MLARFEPEHGAPAESAVNVRGVRLRFNFSRRQDLQGPHAPSLPAPTLPAPSKPGGERAQPPARAGDAEVARVPSDEGVLDGGAGAICDDSASRGSRPSTEDPASPTRLSQRVEAVSPSKVLHLRNIPPDCGELEIGRALEQKGHDPQRVVKIFRKPQALVRMKTIEDVRSPAPPPRRA